MKSMTAVKKALGIAALVAATNSWGYTISSGATDVGNLDLYLGSIGSINEAGLASFLTALPTDSTTYTAADVDRYDNTTFYKVDSAANLYAIYLESIADYFSIKKATSNAAVFANSDQNHWGVFDVTGWGFNPNIRGTVGTLSHHDEVGGTTSVPEPGSVSLLAAGLLGLVAARRLVNKKA